MNKAVIDLCKKVVEDNLNINREDCREIDCSFEDCPFADGWLCILDCPERRLEIAKKYLKDNEIKEENKMEKTFREVIADIKEGEVWECISPIHWNVKEIRYINDEDTKGIEIEFKEETEMYCFREDKEILFRLKRKEYSFGEAFKAYEEGKEIESKYGFTFKKINGEDFVCTGESWEENKESFTLSEIRGKWYIND